MSNSSSRAAEGPFGKLKYYVRYVDMYRPAAISIFLLCALNS